VHALERKLAPSGVLMDTKVTRIGFARIGSEAGEAMAAVQAASGEPAVYETTRCGYRASHNSRGIRAAVLECAISVRLTGTPKSALWGTLLRPTLLEAER
jgi:hypothetical protein